jgi:hypothetical protein
MKWIELLSTEIAASRSAAKRIPGGEDKEQSSVENTGAGFCLILGDDNGHVMEI